MSTKTTSSSGGKKNQHKKSCLAVVEADGLFDGRRRVRLPLGLSSSSSSSYLSNGNQIEQTYIVQDDNDALAVLRREEGLLELKQCLAKALELPSTTNASVMEIELYDSTNQSFRRLTRIDDVPLSCCRLRITTSAMAMSPSPLTSSSSHESKELLALPWREFSSSIDLDGKLVLKGGKHAITIHEVSNSGLGTGTNIWDGAIALAKFLEFHDRDDDDDERGEPDNPATTSHKTDTDTQSGAVRDRTYSIRGKRVLELGAGTGLVGIAAHVAFGAREVILTDLEYSLDNLRDNLNANACRVVKSTDAAPDATTSTQPCTIDARVLDWFDLETCEEVLQRSRLGPLTAAATTETTTGNTPNTRQDRPKAHNSWIPEVVLAADVVWVESLVRPLVQTLHHICTKTSPPLPLILLSYQKRSQAVEDLLFRTLEEFSFRTEDVTSPVVATTSGAESKIRIYRITTYTPRVD
jgi:predicted nicotinamide N-methyase